MLEFSPSRLGNLGSTIYLLQDSAFSSVKQDNNITSFLKLLGELNELMNVKQWQLTMFST